MVAATRGPARRSDAAAAATPPAPYHRSIITMKDTALANAGVVYARPGSAKAQELLDDVAWRVQLFQNWPEIVPEIVPYAKPPYYANSDDQTLLNDAIVSFVTGNRTFLGSTARYEGTPPPPSKRPPPQPAPSETPLSAAAPPSVGTAQCAGRHEQRSPCKRRALGTCRLACRSPLDSSAHHPDSPPNQPRTNPEPTPNRSRVAR